MLAYFLYGLFFISCLVLVGAVLLQPGKADAGALFTSNVSSTAFGPRGTQSVLSRITITAAATFMLSALLLAMPAINGGGVSVLQTTPDSQTVNTVNTNSNTANSNSANANTATDANSATSNPATNTTSNANANK